MAIAENVSFWWVNGAQGLITYKSAYSILPVRPHFASTGKYRELSIDWHNATSISANYLMTEDGMYHALTDTTNDRVVAIRSEVYLWIEKELKEQSDGGGTIPDDILEQIAMLRSAVVDMGVEVKNMGDTVYLNHENIKKNRASIDENWDNISVNRSGIEENGEKIDELDKDIGVHRQALDKLDKEVEDLQIRVSDLEGQADQPLIPEMMDMLRDHELRIAALEATSGISPPRAMLVPKSENAVVRFNQYGGAVLQSWNVPTLYDAVLSHLIVSPEAAGQWLLCPKNARCVAGKVNIRIVGKFDWSQIATSDDHMLMRIYIQGNIYGIGLRDWGLGSFRVERGVTAVDAEYEVDFEMPSAVSAIGTFPTGKFAIQIGAGAIPSSSSRGIEYTVYSVPGKPLFDIPLTI